MTGSAREPEARPAPPQLPAIPRIGLGCAGLGNLYAPVGDDDAIATLEHAWARGIRYFDTAPYYGHGLSESRLGRFLREGRRTEAIVSSKVGRGLRPGGGGPPPDTGFVDAAPFEPYFDYSRDGVLRQVEDTLERLGRAHLDIAFIHDIGRLTHGEAHDLRFREALEGALPALLDLQAQGVVGRVGIGVNEVAACLETLSRVDLDVILLAGRYSLLDQSAAAELFPLCRGRGVSVVIGGPYNSGILAGGDHFDYAPATASIRRRVDRLSKVCEAYGVPLSAAALQFVLRDTTVVCALPGARSKAEVDRSLRNLATQIPADLWRDLRAEGLLTDDQ